MLKLVESTLFSVRARVREKSTVTRKEIAIKFGKGMWRWLRKVETTLNCVQNFNNNESVHKEETKKLRKIDSDATKTYNVADEIMEEVNQNTNGRNSVEMSTIETQNTTEIDQNMNHINEE